MPRDLVCADYAQLKRVAQTFTRAADRIAQLQKFLRDPLQRLKSGGWEGIGASQFFSEMDQQVLPPLTRLRQALLTSATTTTRIGNQLYAAERESAALFGGIGTSLPPSVGLTAASHSGDSAVASMFVKLDASGSNTEQPLFSTPVSSHSEHPQLYADVDALISEAGGIEALVGAIPEVAQWE
jgi:WXG100 family type VII secretion target